MRFFIYSLIVAAMALPGCALADTDLICAGGFIGITYVGESGVPTRPIDVEMKIHLTDTGGTVTLPPQMAFHSAPTRPFTEVKYSDEAITASVRLDWVNKMVFNIDRVTGYITVAVPPYQFNGTCQKYDPATVAKKF